MINRTGFAMILGLCLGCGGGALEGGARPAAAIGGPGAAGAESCTGLCTPQRIAFDGAPTLAVAVDESSIYWIDFTQCFGSAPIMKMDKRGGAPTQLAKGECPAAIAVDQENVYWTDAKSGALRSLPKGGGAVKQLALGEPILFPVSFLAAGPTDLYYSTNYDLRAVAKEGGSPRRLASGGAVWSAAVSGGTVLFALAPVRDAPGELVAFDAARPGAALRALSWGERRPFQMALDAGTITWIPGGGVQPSSPGAAAAAASPVGVAVDRRDVYYASRDRIGRVPLGGGTPASAPLATLAGSLAVDEAAVYVAAVDGIYRIAK